MGIADRLKDLKTKATDATVERSDKIHEAVEKVATTADQRTGGKYRERIQQIGAKADSFVEGLKGSDTTATAQDAGDATEHDAPAQDAQDTPAEDSAG
jgi:MT0933-like antitoxin protein